MTKKEDIKKCSAGEITALFDKLKFGIRIIGSQSANVDLCAMNQDFYRDVYLILKMGFPMLWLVTSIMALVAVWKDGRSTQNKKIFWTAIIVLIPIIGVGIYLIWGYR